MYNLKKPIEWLFSENWLHVVFEKLPIVHPYINLLGQIVWHVRDVQSEGSSTDTPVKVYDEEIAPADVQQGCHELRCGRNHWLVDRL